LLYSISGRVNFKISYWHYLSHLNTHYKKVKNKPAACILLLKYRNLVQMELGTNIEYRNLKKWVSRFWRSVSSIEISKGPISRIGIYPFKGPTSTKCNMLQPPCYFPLLSHFSWWHANYFSKMNLNLLFHDRLYIASISKSTFKLGCSIQN